MPTVSVVIPAHNRAAYLGEAIDSVRSQTFVDWELLIVDDGSTDRTREVVAAHRDDARIRYCYQSHQERSAARNRGIADTSGPYIAFLDADDVWKPQKLARQVLALEHAPETALCYTLTGRIDAEGRALDAGRHLRAPTGYVLSRLLRQDFIANSSVTIRRCCLKRVGAFDATLPVYGREDWDLWLRIARWYPILPVKEELTLHRVHEGNTSHERSFASGLAVLEKLSRDREFIAEARMSPQAMFAYLYIGAAGAPDARLPRATRATRLAWAVAHHPPSLGSRWALIALTRLLLPERLVRYARRGYRKWLLTANG